MTTFKSKVELGKLYKDKRLAIEGWATVVCFQPHGCVEVQLEFMGKDGKPENALVNELRLRTSNDAELTETHEYETDLVVGHEYEDIETGLRGHLSQVEFFEHMATRGILRRVAADAQGFETIKYVSIDDFLLKDISTQEVAEPKTEKRSPATFEYEGR